MTLPTTSLTNLDTQYQGLLSTFNNYNLHPSGKKKHTVPFPLEKNHTAPPDLKNGYSLIPLFASDLGESFESSEIILVL